MLFESVQRAELLSISPDSNLLSYNAPLSFDTISIYARHEFRNVYDQRMDKGDLAWYMDQVLCSMLLTDYRHNHPEFLVSERSLGQRLDRVANISFWNRDNFEKFVDAHLFDDQIFDPSYWKVFNRFLSFVFKPHQVHLFNEYYQLYKKLLPQSLRG